MEARKVIEVIPLVTLRACHNAPAYVAGMANYHETAVPVMDFGRLLGGMPCAMFLSTRIILTSCAAGGDKQRVIGLLAETVTDAVEREESDFSEDNVAVPGTSCLGKLAINGSGFLQRITVDRLVSKELEQMLFANPEQSPS